MGYPGVAGLTAPPHTPTSSQAAIIAVTGAEQGMPCEKQPSRTHAGPGSQPSRLDKRSFLIAASIGGAPRAH